MNWTTIQTMVGYPLYDLIEEAWCLLGGYEDGIYGKCVKLIYLRGCITIPFVEGRFEMSKPVLPDPPEPPVDPEEPDPENPTDPSNPENPDTGDEDDEPTTGDGNNSGNDGSIE